ncbi:MAG TPA: acyl carrier protein [Nitrospiria bacterium]|nr:acyl carrier protein [Nitrospiria bacterium]
MESTDLIEERIKGRLAEKFQKNASDILSESRLVQDLGLDSLDTFELLFELENEFNIGIPTADALAFVRVQDVVSYIQNKTKPA